MAGVNEGIFEEDKQVVRKKTPSTEQVKLSSRPSRSGSRKDKSGQKGSDPTDTNEAWICNICKKKFSDPAAKMLECLRCEDHFCIKCLKKSEQEYKYLQKEDNLWTCQACQGKARIEIKKGFNFERECERIMETFELRVQRLEKEIEEKCTIEQVETLLKTKMSEKWDTDEVKQIIGQEIRNKVTPIQEAAEKKETENVIEELNDRQDRENNIIIKGIPELISENNQARKQHDMQKLEELLTTCNIENPGESIVQTRRIGKFDREKDPNKRLIQVTLDSQETKRDIFRNAKKLRNQAQYQEIYITNDLTILERNKEYELRQEARAKNLDASDDYFFRVGGRPGKRRVMRIKQPRTIEPQTEEDKAQEVTTGN